MVDKLHLKHQIQLKYLVIDTPYGVVGAKKSDLENIKDLISLGNFNDYFRLANNTFTAMTLTTVDLEIIRDMIIEARNNIKKGFWDKK